MTNILRFFALCISCVWLLAACAPATEKADLQLNDLSLTFDAPLFEGPNTASVGISSALAEALQTRQLSLEKVEDAQLRSIRVSLPALPEGVELSSITLSFSGDKVEMRTFGSKNPVPQNESSFELDIAEKQKKMSDFLKDPGLTLVLDIGLKGDTEEDIQAKVDLIFDLDVVQ